MKRHPTDRLSLAFGLLFLATVAGWLVFRSVDVNVGMAGWLLAGGLILFGVLGLIGSLRPRSQPVSSQPVSSQPVSGSPRPGDPDDK